MRLWGPKKDPGTTIGKVKSQTAFALPSDGFDYSEAEIRHFLALAFPQLIAVLPMKGIRELADTFCEVYVFYLQSPLRKETSLLPPPVKYKEAIFLGREKSPPFVMEFDEE